MPHSSRWSLILPLIFLFLTSNAQVESLQEFNTLLDKVLGLHVSSNGTIDYKGLSDDSDISSLVSYINQADLTNASEFDLKAFRINAYNLMVVNQVLENYPIATVQEVSGFFDRNKLLIEGELTTLNNYEKSKLLNHFEDPRLHFVLVCGALGCPPIIEVAYRGEILEQQLDRQTRIALNNPEFIKYSSSDFQISQIFNWYATDFGRSSKKIVQFINSYRIDSIDKSLSLKYYEYDWSLNDQDISSLAVVDGNSSNRYVVSAAIPKGTYELKVFNNLYSQIDRINNNRSTFFTSAFNALYGVSNRFNAGVLGRFRTVTNHFPSGQVIDFFSRGNLTSERTGLTALGPQLRIAPVPSWPNFSIQSTFTFPIGKQLEGESGDKPFIDWSGAVFQNQFFNDFTLSSKWSIFAEIDIIIEDISFDLDQGAFRTSTPVIGILSYFPTPMATIYALGGFSPFWQREFDYFYQFGIGAKYQITSDFEVELLSSYFQNKYLPTVDGVAGTYNLGLRYSIR